ncbi:MAG: ketoacyl-ACP synthase III [Planctomycetaceae bacterium]|jgi:3-oxoacyl-[acyl-carrier-protein] synthase-3|nr:ketoacyl-ACP synthase III [Planctomycetaceae bacterium]
MTVQAEIRSIAYYLPENYLGNAELAQSFPNWTEEKIVYKLGIERRPIAALEETATDMGVKAAENLFENGCCEPEAIDFLLFCTQSPDYFLPTSACLIHERLGLPKSCGALDFNLGCSGYIYGLSLAKGIIETGSAQNVLLITSETYSKYINREDRGSRPLFGDGASATLISAVPVPVYTNTNIVYAETTNASGNANADVNDSASDSNSDSANTTATANTNATVTEPLIEEPLIEPLIGPFVFGTDGSGADLLIVPAGGHRIPKTPETAQEIPDGKGNIRSKEQLKMHGPGIFSFAIDRVPPLVEELLNKSGKNREDIGCYIFHQANKYMLDRLQELCRLEELNYFNNMLQRGNTVSSSIPIAIVDAWRAGMLKPKQWTMLIGFGVGLSWGGTLIQLPVDFVV